MRHLSSWLMLAALAAAGCKRSQSDSTPVVAVTSSQAGHAGAPDSQRPSAKSATPLPELNVLLITVDALRADMPWLGYPRDIAPRLTALSKQSVVYSHAYALSSYTSMSLAGLMSGRYPLELPRDGRATSTFFDDALFLAEVMQAGGLRTVGVHGHVYFLGATGINQGFNDWRVLPRITVNPARQGYVSDDKLADLMIDALSAQPSDRRFFGWVHFMDPHFDYAPHPELPSYRGSPYADSAEPVAPGVALSEVGQTLRNRYDREVRFTDAQVGRLLDFVERQPWGKNTAIVVTADHGEAFGEHKSYFEHGFLLYDVTVRVPLMFRVPGVEPRRIDVRRSHVDLARTLLELAGLKPPESMRGKSLVAELRGASAEARPIVIDMPYTDQTPRRRALIDSGKKLIVTDSETVPELYDLDADPGERHNLAGDPEQLEPAQARYRELDSKLEDYPAARHNRRQY